MGHKHVFELIPTEFSDSRITENWFRGFVPDVSVLDHINVWNFFQLNWRAGSTVSLIQTQANIRKLVHLAQFPYAATAVSVRTILRRLEVHTHTL